MHGDCRPPALARRAVGGALGAPEDPSPKSETTPPSQGVRRLTRSSSDKLIGGVAGGLGRYFGVDPILFRIAFVVLTFAGGVGAAYVTPSIREIGIPVALAASGDPKDKDKDKDKKPK